MRGINSAVLLCFILMTSPVKSQYYSTGQDPASIRWKQISAKSFTIIYPSSFEKNAQNLANVMDLVSRYETSSISAKVPRIPVVLHTASSVSNGVTVWAPKRIEMFPALPPQSYPEDWLEQLAVHEYRHAVQISSVNKGFTKVLSYIFGEQATGGILGLYLPVWFLEGDATVTETALSKTGRGRSALFECTLRAQILEKGIYPFDKATLGSYKTFIPDSYSLGYYLVAQSRARYGGNFWNEACDRSGKYPFMAVPFNSGIRKNSGLWKTGLYHQALSDLDSTWRIRDLQIKQISGNFLTKPDKKNFTNFFQPQYLNENQIIAEKTGMDDVAKFCTVDRKTGEIKPVFVPGPRLENTSSAGGRYLAWTEFRRDIRWQNRSYSEIRVLNLENGKVRYLTRKSRYFSPALNQDGGKLVSVEHNDLNESILVILDAQSGQIINSYSLPAGQVAMNPSWDLQSRKIIFTLQDKNGQALAEWLPVTNRIHILMPFSWREINGKSINYGKYIIFSSQYNGIENLFALDTLTGKVSQVTFSRFAATGISSVSPTGKLLYTDYTSDGFMISEIQADTTKWIPVQQSEDQFYCLSDILAKQEKVNIQDSLMNNKQTCFPSKRYSRFTHLFNPHSWAPVSFSVADITLNPGVMLLSQNTLSSLFATAGWEYNMNEKTGKFYAGFSYQGLYPVFDFSFDAGKRAGYARYSDTSAVFRFLWQEMNLKFAVSVPWNFSSGRWNRRLQPKIGISLIDVQHLDETPTQFFSGLITSMDYQLYCTQSQYKSARDLEPAFGQTIEFDFRHTPFGQPDMGSIAAVTSRFYFPGFFRHHSFNFYAGYQQYKPYSSVAYSYSDFIRVPRGYSGISHEQMFTTQFNYAFPVCYPDLSLGSLVYFKRLKMNLFYDYTQGHDQGVDACYSSAGTEVTADFHLLRFIAPITCGARFCWFPSDASWNWEFLYSVNLP